VRPTVEDKVARKQGAGPSTAAQRRLISRAPAKHALGSVEVLEPCICGEGKSNG